MHGVDPLFLNLSELPFLHHLNADNNSVDMFFPCLRADFVSHKRLQHLEFKSILNFSSVNSKLWFCLRLESSTYKCIILLIN